MFDRETMKGVLFSVRFLAFATNLVVLYHHMEPMDAVSSYGTI